MYTYDVGKLYHPAKTRWAECAQFNVRGGQAELVLFYNQPSASEILAVKQSSCEFGLVCFGPVIFLLYRFDNAIPWSDQPFTIQLVPQPEQIIPKLENEWQRFLMVIFLVDATTGILKVIRVVTLSPEISRQIIEAMRQQLATPFNANEYNLEIQRAYTKYPQTEALVRDCRTFSKSEWT